MGLPPGRAGVLRTLHLMRSLVHSTAGKASMPVRQTALSLVSHLSPKDYTGEVWALQRFVRDCIRYVRDIRGMETLQTPERTLMERQGDCDDKSTLLAAMLESVGARTRFEAVGFAPQQFSHVFPAVNLAGRWIALETIVPGKEPGWRPPRVVDTITLEN